jgi:hypothetical protein
MMEITLEGMRAEVLARCWEQVNVLAEMVATAQRNRMMPVPASYRLSEAARLLAELEELTGGDGVLHSGLVSNAQHQPEVHVEMVVRVETHSHDEPERPGPDLRSAVQAFIDDAVARDSAVRLDEPVWPVGARVVFDNGAGGQWVTIADHPVAVGDQTAHVDFDGGGRSTVYIDQLSSGPEPMWVPKAGEPATWRFPGRAPCLVVLLRRITLDQWKVRGPGGETEAFDSELSAPTPMREEASA